MSITTAWLKQRQDITGLSYTPIAHQLETLDACRNPNDMAASQRFLQILLDTTAQHEAGKQLPLFRGGPAR